ncbi:MAG: hypothetical protein KAW67_02390 [Candidatus Eisenbacteria sp.]|nr:hypothetical protein [Candidatus Eisenbacteria bacterium]
MITRLLGIGLAAIALLATPIAHADPVQWSGNGHFYDVVAESRTWTSAWTQAASMTWGQYRGHLATVTSAEEQAFLEATFGELLNMSFLGGYQSPTSAPPADKWHWLTGEPWSFTHWASGEPNDVGGPEYWIEVQQIGTTYMWNDWGPNDGVRPRFVVEYELVPSPILTGPILHSGNGHSYYLTAEMSWQSAQELALTLEGDLATINDAGEQEWVFTTFGSFDERYRSLWLGLNDELNEGEFVWVSGEPVTYWNWLWDIIPGDGYGGEDYVHMIRVTEGVSGVEGEWNNLQSPSVSYYNFDPLHGVIEVPFEVVAVEQTTWGRIKAQFRKGGLVLPPN